MADVLINRPLTRDEQALQRACVKSLVHTAQTAIGHACDLVADTHDENSMLSVSLNELHAGCIYVADVVLPEERRREADG